MSDVKPTPYALWKQAGGSETQDRYEQLLVEHGYGIFTVPLPPRETIDECCIIAMGTVADLAEDEGSTDVDLTCDCGRKWHRRERFPGRWAWSSRSLGEHLGDARGRDRFIPDERDSKD